MLAVAWLVSHVTVAMAQTWSRYYEEGPWRVQNPCAAFGNGEIWAFGGKGFNNTLPTDFIENNEMWAYDVTNDAWRNASAPDGPTMRSLSSAVFIGDKVYIYGGTGPDYAGDLFAYDTLSLSWLELTPGGTVPTTRSRHAAVVDGAGRMWILGGYGTTEFETYVYDVTGNSWSQAADGFFGMYYHAVVYEPAENKIWSFAGLPETNGHGWYASKELWCYDITLNTWTNFTQSGGPENRREHVAVLAESQGSRGTMWVHGGYNYDGSVYKYYDVWSYDIATDTWSEWPSTSSYSRYKHAAVFDSVTSVMWIYAGTYSSVEADVRAFLTVPTTTLTTTITSVTTTSVTTTTSTATIVTSTTTTTTTLATTILPVNAVSALRVVEERQDYISGILRASLSNVNDVNVSADGFTLAEAEDLTLDGTAIISKALLTPSNGLSFSYDNVNVELPGALLQGLDDGFVLSMGLINRNSSSFDFFEKPPAVLVSPIVSVELYNSAGNDISELAAPLLLTFPRPELQGRFRAQCVFWDEGLQAWSTNGLSLVSETADQVTCAAEHLSLLALLFFPFACSNAAAIFSQQGVDALMDPSWAWQLPALITWIILFMGFALLIFAALLDRRHKKHRKQMLKRLETSEEVKYTKKKSMELPEEKVQIHPKSIKKLLLKHLHTQIIMSELGVDLAFLKQLYTTGGFSPIHAQAKALVEKFYSSSLRAKTALLFRVHCSWMKFSHPMMRSTSVQRCAETLAKFWSGLALVAVWYNSTALAAHQPAECAGVKGLVEMIVRGFVVSTVGAVIGLLPLLAVIIIQQKMIRKLGLAARIFFWTFVALYFLISFYVVCVFLASVSQMDGIDFLVGVLTAVARTILIMPWLGVGFFMLVITFLKVDMTTGLPFETNSTGQSFLRVDIESLSLTSRSETGPSICFKCQVPGHFEAVMVKEQDARAPGVFFQGLSENQILLLSVYEVYESNEKLRLLGATAVLVNELKNSQELPLQLRGRPLDVSVLMTVKRSELAPAELPTLVESQISSKSVASKDSAELRAMSLEADADNNEPAADVEEPATVEVHVASFQEEGMDEGLFTETI